MFDKETKTLLDLELKIIPLENKCFGIFASDINKMQTRFNQIKEIYPKTTACISLNSCKGNLLVDLTGKKYLLFEINKETLLREYKKEIQKSLEMEPEEMVKRISKVQNAFGWYLRRAK